MNPFHLPSQGSKEVIEQDQLVMRLSSTPFLNVALEKRGEREGKNNNKRSSKAKNQTDERFKYAEI